MNGLFLLVSLSFVPVSAGQYTGAITTARDAAFIQSGLKHDWDTVAAATAKKVPKPVSQAISLGTAVYKREAVLRTRSYGTYDVSPTSISASFSFSF